jgi:hypothetical protein
LVANLEDRWSYAESSEAVCGANGDPDTFLSPAICLWPPAPVGALIGKFGGSTAGLDDGTRFIAGAYCVLTAPEEGGPLYLTINDEYTGFDNNAGSIGVSAYVRATKEARVGTP